MTIQEIQKLIMDQAKEKGWGIKASDINFAEKIALLHQEISEVLEAYRQKRMTGRHSVKEELADALARLLQLAAIYDIDLEKELLEKIKINQNRDWSDDQLYIDKRAGKN